MTRSRPAPADLSPQSRAALVGAIETRFGLALLEGVKASVASFAKKLLAREQIELSELLHRLEGGADTDPIVSRMREAASIGETYFFRVPAQLQALQASVIELLASHKTGAGRRQLRVWSAACSTGEEVYTLAILFRRALPDFDISVLGTDMNEAALEVGRAGFYQGRSFRAVTGRSLAGMLVEDGPGWSVSAEVRRMVSFQRLNLVTDSFPAQDRRIGNFDVVVCRNVLIYLAPARIPAVMAKLAASCAPNSILVLTPAEYAAARHATGFVDSSQGILVRRAGGVGGRPSAAPSAPPAPAAHREVDARPPPPPPPSVAPPDPFTGLLERARQAADRGDFEPAQALIEQARTVRPDAAEPHCLLGATFHALGRWEDAAREYQKAAYLDRQLVAAQLGLGLALTAARRPGEARCHFARVLALSNGLPGDAIVPTTGITVTVAQRIAASALEELQ